MKQTTDKQTATVRQKAPTAPTHVELTHISQELRQTQSRLRNAGQRNGELCGRIESLEGERDHYKSHADKLAGALRDIETLAQCTVPQCNIAGHLRAIECKATKVLAAYEEAAQ